ncbi:tumor necrosis factor isoform X2 [Tachyglossus aculeatus]|uniref:tumor necrosis factor isoform X2 n=1 Tax=Tachyglossus aculeatus TaxID=9261 RepID=UPI0018F7B386|nr:tumor necrosis factor isoform X2 [Tachyglossus aculeatus]
MSMENMLRDIELAGEPAGKTAGARRFGHCLCLSLISFFLVAGATTLFCLIHFGVIGPQDREDSPLLPLTQMLKSYQPSAEKPAAHVVANSQEDKKLVWVGGRANALLEGSVILNNNQLVVPASGLYLVYSQILFKDSSCPANPDDSPILTHNVSRFSESYEHEVSILSAIKTPCQGGAKGTWYEPIYQGGIFRLNQGDRLSSQTNSPEYLDFSMEGQVYFGIIAL